MVQRLLLSSITVLYSMIYASFYDMFQVHANLPLSFQIALETYLASKSASIMSRSFTAPQVL